MSKNNLSKKKTVCGAILCIFAAFAAINVWENVTVGVSHYEIGSKHLPASFNGYKIAQISDLHNAEFGKNNSQIIDKLRAEQPDMIFFTGDIVDSTRTDVDVAIDFVKQATEISKCYYVPGNHEAWIGEDYDKLVSQMEENGCVVIRDEVIEIEKDTEKIQLVGLTDPDFTHDHTLNQSDVISERLDGMNLEEGYKILLSHRPELFSVYAEKGIDTIFSGHAHGGQFRIPFVGGMFAPNQGFLPKYDAGVYRENASTMIVSRGIGNSVIPVRINNRPEIVVVTLNNEEKK